MTDFALVRTGAGISSDIAADPSTKQYQTETGLASAVRMSIYTRARAKPGDELPSGDGSFGENLGGYWAESLLDDGYQYGSRLWTLGRSKLTPETRQRARDFVVESLEWLTGLGIAREYEVETEIAARGVLCFLVKVYRENEPPATFDYLWNFQGAT